MRQKLGAFLCLALGAVLISTGLDPSGAASVGVTPMNCGDVTSAGVTNPGYCPTGTITLTEVTDTTADPAATVPASWSVTIESVDPVQCNLPGGSPTQTVPNDGGPISFDGLYIFQDTATDTYCTYKITEAAVPGFSDTYAPSAPYSFVYVQPTLAKKPHALQAPSPLPVVLTNTAAAASTSPTPTPTPSTTTPSVTPSSTGASSTAAGSVTPSVSPSSTVVCAAAARYQAAQRRCVGPSFSASSSPESASTSPALANTGTNKPIGASLYLGVGLCLLGVVLLFAGRRRRGEHA